MRKFLVGLAGSLAAALFLLLLLKHSDFPTILFGTLALSLFLCRNLFSHSDLWLGARVPTLPKRVALSLLALSLFGSANRIHAQERHDQPSKDLLKELKSYPHKIVYE